MCRWGTNLTQTNESLICNYKSDADNVACWTGVQTKKLPVIKMHSAGNCDTQTGIIHVYEHARELLWTSYLPFIYSFPSLLVDCLNSNRAGVHKYSYGALQSPSDNEINTTQTQTDPCALSPPAQVALRGRDCGRSYQSQLSLATARVKSSLMSEQ